MLSEMGMCFTIVLLLDEEGYKRQLTVYNVSFKANNVSRYRERRGHVTADVLSRSLFLVYEQCFLSVVPGKSASCCLYQSSWGGCPLLLSLTLLAHK